MDFTAESVRKLAELGSRILAAEAALLALRAEAEQLVTGKVSTSAFSASAPTERKRAGRNVGPDSPTARVLATINENAPIEFDAAMLSKELGIPVKQVQTSLHNLWKAKKIAKLRRGEYQALSGSFKDSKIDLNDLGYSTVEASV